MIAKYSYKTPVFLVCFPFLFVSCWRSSSQYFLDFFAFPPTEDVKNINSYADETGIDASYWLAFECEDSTIHKIIANLQLEEHKSETQGLYGGLNSSPTSWWDTAFVAHSKPFYNENEQDRICSFLWYNNKVKKAYFLTFDF
jgi:hypothetical protein